MRARFERADPILNVRGVEDVATKSTQSAGAKIRRNPENYSRAYEMQVEDPDGHVLRLGSEPRTDMPLADRRR